MAETTEPVEVSISDIQNWLDKGVTRCIDDPGYRADLESIQEKYSLTKTEVKALFQDERLKGLRTNRASRIIIIEDKVDSEPVVEAIPSRRLTQPIEAPTQEEDRYENDQDSESPVTDQGTPEMEETGEHLS